MSYGCLNHESLPHPFLLGAHEGRDEVVEQKRASMEYGF
jgi:hypothetical protein